MSSLEKLLGSTDPFLEKVHLGLEKSSVDVAGLELDHICYRVETCRRYLELRNTLITYHGTALSEAWIGGRPITTFRLRRPILYMAREIFVLELPAPKEGSFYEEGFEHAEFVIDLGFEDFIAKHPELSFETKGLVKEINPDIALKYDGFSVKFHQNSLEYVITHLE
jgi:predicted metalloenzyme YecM